MRIRLRLFTAASLLMVWFQAFPLPGQTTIRLFEYTNAWRYLPNTNAPTFAPADAWTASGFEDQAWPTGRGLLGFETSPAIPIVFAPVNTFIAPPSGGGAPSTYFRSQFHWSGPLDWVVLHFTNAVDDGMIVYLNGQELFSFNMPDQPRPMVWDLVTLPGGSNPLGEGVAMVTNLIAPGLISGENVIAVELHQQGVTSGDDLFGMTLAATLPLAPINLAPDQPRDQVVLAYVPFTLVTQAAGSPPPEYQWFGNGQAIPGATSASYTVTNGSPCTIGPLEPHRFFCQVSNGLGSFVTREAQISFVVDGSPPMVTRVSGSANLSNVVVEFSEFMIRPGVEDPFSYQVLDETGRSLNIMEARLAPNRSSVVLTLDNPLLELASYQLRIEPGSIRDLCSNAVPASVTPFQAWAGNPCAGLSFETYRAPQGTPTEPIPPEQEPWRVNFPDHPSEQLRFSGAFDSREAYPDNSHEAYGGRMRGLFVPPVSGWWRFFLRSDDASELWLNPAGPGANGAVLVAREAVCCSPFVEPPALQTSQTFWLLAGKAYYLEAIWNEVVDVDYCQVAARLEGDLTPAGLLPPIPPDWLGAFLPAGATGSFQILRSPASLEVGLGEQATFDVQVDTDVPVCYQWLRDGAEIPGAIGARYSFLVEAASDAGRYCVRVTLPGGPTRTSECAQLLLPLTLISNSVHQVWVYRDDGVDLGTSWRERDYNQDAWPAGLGPLGWEDQGVMPAGWPIRTVLTGFAAQTPKPTVYFRTHFALPTDPRTVTRLELREVVDDGAAVYLNGQVVHTNRLLAPIRFETLSVGFGVEPHVVEGPFQLPPLMLRAGENVLAVEVHQNSPNSGDVVYGAELVATVSQYGLGLDLVPVSTTSARLEWVDPTFHVETAPGPDGPWTTDAGLVSGSTVRTDLGRRYFRLRR